MCLNSVDKRERRHLGLDELKKIIKDIPFIKKISLVGAGEPLMNPELFSMLAYAKSQGIAVGFATNGLLLDNESCGKIINTGVDWLNLSLDSPHKHSYENIREGAEFEKVIGNIDNLIKLRGKNKSPLISLWFVIMEDNFQELPEMIDLAKRLKINRVLAQLGHSWSNNRLKNYIKGLYNDRFQSGLRIILRETKRRALRNGVSFSYVNIPDISSGRACKWPWKSCYITAEGYVTPCCLHGTDPTFINFGNLFKDSFATIWNSAGYQDFRRRLKYGEPINICGGCPAYYKKLKI
jgi:radical SAM protein with 4Fe4S-binding SPASM domain